MKCIYVLQCTYTYINIWAVFKLMAFTCNEFHNNQKVNQHTQFKYLNNYSLSHRVDICESISIILLSAPCVQCTFIEFDVIFNDAYAKAFNFKL